MTENKQVQYKYRVTYQSELRQIDRPDLVRWITARDEQSLVIVDHRFMKLNMPFFRDIPSNIPIKAIKIKSDSKNESELRDIYDFLLEHKAHRNSLVIAMGGGTLTDLAGYAVSTFKRGVGLVLIPTTALGMVDAALGGKTAIDFHETKNMIGSFYPAETILFCHDFLKTLAEEDIINGWAEIIKLYLINDGWELPELLHVNYTPPRELIWQAANRKMEICSTDLHDRDNRRMLNAGHTFGHVIEAVSQHRVPHGIAVILGVHTAAVWSRDAGSIDAGTMQRIRNLLQEFPIEKYITRSLVKEIENQGLNHLLQDKKADGKLQLILFNGWRSAVVSEAAEPQKVLKCLTETLSEMIK